MSDDSFFREVDEELRQDKVKAVWTRFGTWLLVGAVAVVAVTAGTVAYEHYQTTNANAAGDRFAQAVKLADDGKPDEALKALQAVIDNGVGAYPALARLSIGGIEAKAGRTKEAVAAYDAVSATDGAPNGLRDMAAIRAAYVLVDSGTLDDVRQRVERLSGDSDPLRFPAREAIALAAWKADDAKTAKPLLDQLVTDPGTPRDISGRARILLDLINSGATGPNALPPAEDNGTAAAPAADNGLGTIDLQGMLDGGEEAPSTGEGGAGPDLGGAAMPTTNLGETTNPALEPAPAGTPAQAEAPAPDTSVQQPAPNATPSASQNSTPEPATDSQPPSLATDGAAPAPAAADAPAADAAPAETVPPAATNGTTTSTEPNGN